jgi:transcription elongation factor Elf1
MSFNDCNERELHVEFTHRLEVSVSFFNGLSQYEFYWLVNGLEEIQRIRRSSNALFKCPRCSKSYRWATSIRKHARICQLSSVSENLITERDISNLRNVEENALYIQQNGSQIKIADYNQESNIVYCILNGCFLPLNFCSIPYHYHNKHKLKISDTELTTLSSNIFSLIDEDRNSVSLEYTKNLTRNELAPMPMLDIQNGFECLLCPDNKVYYCISKKTMRAHYSRNHNGMAQLVRPVSVQCFNKNLKTPWFKVRTGNLEALTASNVNAIFLKRKFVETTNHVHPTPSFKRKSYIEELQMKNAVSDILSSGLLAFDQNMAQKHFFESIFQRYFMLGYSLLDKPNECSFLLKRHIRDPQQDKHSNRVMKKFLNEGTTTAYMRQGSQLFMFLIACKNEIDKNGKSIESVHQI